MACIAVNEYEHVHPTCSECLRLVFALFVAFVPEKALKAHSSFLQSRAGVLLAPAMKVQ
jgi:hypothetical protein